MIRKRLQGQDVVAPAVHLLRARFAGPGGSGESGGGTCRRVEPDRRRRCRVGVAASTWWRRVAMSAHRRHSSRAHVRRGRARWPSRGSAVGRDRERAGSPRRPSAGSAAAPGVAEARRCRLGMLNSRPIGQGGRGRLLGGGAVPSRPWAPRCGIRRPGGSRPHGCGQRRGWARLPPGRRLCRWTRHRLGGRRWPAVSSRPLISTRLMPATMMSPSADGGSTCGEAPVSP